MRRIIPMLLADIRFQVLHGFYYVYAFLVIVYIFLLHFSPKVYLEPMTVLIIFTDPTLLGAFFVGGIVLLEKSQGIYDPLFITSLKVREFIVAKVISLSIISVATSLAILIFVHSVAFQLLPVLLGVWLSSIVFTLIGLLLAVRVQSVNQYLLASPLVLTIFFIPIVTIFDWWDAAILKVLPSYAGIVLIEGAFRTLSIVEGLYAILNLISWSVLLFVLVEKTFNRHVLAKVGE